MPTLTVPDYAKHRGITVRSVRRYLADGTIPAAATVRRGRLLFVDLGKADKALARNVAFSRKDVLTDQQPAKAAAPREAAQKQAVARKAGTDGLTYSEARTVTQQYKAALLKLDFDQRTGQLLDAGQVRAAAFDRGRAVRDALLNVPDRVAPILAAETDPVKVSLLLRSEITAALGELSDTPSSPMVTPAPSPNADEAAA